MSLIERIKQVFALGRQWVGAQPQRAIPAAAASEYIVIVKDGATHTFVAGTTAYAKGNEPPGGHRPATTIECNG